MRFLLLLFIMISGPSAMAADQWQTIQLEKGVVLKVQQHKANRTLPHAYYDQAVSSIATIYPNHVYLVKRRYGRLGAMEYSVVCYKETNKSTEIVLSGMAVNNNVAWTFDTHFDQSEFGDKLLMVLEAVEKLPVNKGSRATPGSGKTDH